MRERGYCCVVVCVYVVWVADKDDCPNVFIYFRKAKKRHLGHVTHIDWLQATTFHFLFFLMKNGRI